MGRGDFVAEKKSKKPRTRMTKTEITLIVNYVMAVAVTAATAVFCIITKSMDGLVTLACAWVAETAVFSAFYCWKEKNANRQKYAQQWEKEISSSMSADEAARFAEIVLKD